MNLDQIKNKLNTLIIFEGSIDLEILEGGMTNYTYLVLVGKKKYVAKIVDDNMYYGPIRSHEIEASKAGHRAGISPKVIYY